MARTRGALVAGSALCNGLAVDHRLKGNQAECSCPLTQPPDSRGFMSCVNVDGPRNKFNGLSRPCIESPVSRFLAVLAEKQLCYDCGGNSSAALTNATTLASVPLSVRLQPSSVSQVLQTPSDLSRITTVFRNRRDHPCRGAEV